MPRLAFVVVALAVTAAATAGCKTDNPNSCELAANAGKPDCTMIDSGQPVMDKCKAAPDCASTPATPACDTLKEGGTCVQCTAGDLRVCAATATTPRCENDMCVACVDDADCGGTGVCLLDGSCAVVDNIIHATPAGSSDDDCGTLTKPCGLTKAVAVATSQKNIIKLDSDGTYNADNVTITKTVTIDARGATAGGAIIKRSNNGPILTITGGATTILGGMVQGSVNGNADGIVCTSNASPTTSITIVGSVITGNERSAINSDTCALNIVKTTISSNSHRQNQYSPAITSSNGSLTVSQSLFTMNQGGAISVSNGATFTIVGNVFSINGDGAGPLGGMSLVTTSTSNRLEFNTIVNNVVQLGASAPGVHCLSTDFVARNNIIWGNVGAAGIQVDGNCKHDYSDIQQTLLPANDNGNNLTPSQDPLFNADFSVQATSPVRGRADPGSSLTGIASHDIAGKPRTAVPSDIGAYLVPAQ